jgi:hypothetical protein
MDEAMSQAYSRLMTHEFALEAIAATLLSLMPQAAADEWLQEFQAKTRKVIVPENSACTDIEATRIVSDSIEMTDHFVEKVRDRVQRIRAARPPGV